MLAIDNHDGVNVVWHDDMFHQFNILVMGWHGFELGICHDSDGREAHLCTLDRSKYASTIRTADSHEIPSAGTVIPAAEASGFSAVFRPVEHRSGNFATNIIGCPAADGVETLQATSLRCFILDALPHLRCRPGDGKLNWRLLCICDRESLDRMGVGGSSLRVVFLR